MTVWTLLTQSTKRSQVDQTSSSLVRTHIFTCWCTSTAALNNPRLSFFVCGSILYVYLFLFIYVPHASLLCWLLFSWGSHSPRHYDFSTFSSPSSALKGSSEMNARAYCSLFGFKGADQQKKVGALSGYLISPFSSFFTSVSVTLALSFYQPLFELFTSPSSYRHYSKKIHFCQSFLHFLLIVAMN